MNTGVCFDCGGSGVIYQHHLNRPDPATIPLCPRCHKRRHTVLMGSIPLSQYLNREQRNTYMMLMMTKTAEISALESKYENIFKRLRVAIEARYHTKALTLFKQYLGSVLPDYALVNYPKPIWNLSFFEYHKPKRAANGDPHTED